MKQTYLTSIAVAVAAVFCMATSPAWAEEGVKYSCALRVGTASADQTTTKDSGSNKGDRNARTSVKTKTTSRSLTWPVTVLVSGKTPPPSDSVKLKCYFMGTTNGRPALLGEHTVPVSLDAKGHFKTNVTSPVEKLVHTTTRANGRGRSRGSGRGRSASLKSETTGSRVTGCIIQLIVNGKVERYYSTNPNWNKAAKKLSLTESEILGTK